MPFGNSVLVLNIHWGFSFGGISQYTHEVDGMSSCADINISNLCILNKKRHIDTKALNKLSDLTVIHRKGLYDLRWIGMLLEFVKEKKPDLIFTHAFNSHFAAVVLKYLSKQDQTFIASYHGRYHAPNKLKRILVGPYNWFNEWYLARVAKRIITVAGCGQTYLISKGVPGHKIRVIHNGIPSDVVISHSSTELLADLDIPDDLTVIGAISRFEPIKGLNYLIEAFARLSLDFPRACLVMIGSGTQEDELKQLVETLGVMDKVYFPGFRSDAARYLSIMDIYVLPSLSEFHSIGLLEAMRAGRAIVATNVGGNTESITDKTEGLVVPSGDENGLEEALRKLLESPGLREELGGAARERFLHKFTLEVMIEKTADFVIEAAQG